MQCENTTTLSDSRLLLVNDRILGLKPVSEILGNAGYNISMSLNGYNMLASLLHEKYDLVIFDLSNSILSAFEILQQIRTALPEMSINILFLMDQDEESSRVYSINNRYVDFLSAPFSREELFMRVNSILESIYAYREIEEKKYLLESINYACRIQKSLLPDASELESLFREHFILDLPLNMVSGDFYWVKKLKDSIVFVVADCMGHGVPGALLSVLGISLLNEITAHIESVSPSHLLNDLSDKFVRSLMKGGVKENDGLGMDLVAGSINLQDNTLSVAGAYNSVYIIRKGRTIELKGDPRPVGFFPYHEPFTEKTIPLYRDDMIYAASDGYEDQFGGPYSKKFQKKNMIELFRSLSEKPMNVQKQDLYESHLDWKGNQMQLDDILVMGFRI